MSLYFTISVNEPMLRGCVVRGDCHGFRTVEACHSGLPVMRTVRIGVAIV